MLCKKCVFIFYCVHLAFTGNAQERNVPFFTTKNYYSIEGGVAYPYFQARNTNSSLSSQTYQYTFDDLTFNYGSYIGIGYGHDFGEKVSLKLGASCMFSKFSKFNVHYEVFTNSGNKKLKDYYGPAHYYNLGGMFPIGLGYKFNNTVTINAGVFIFKPFFDREYWKFEYDEFFPPRHGSYYRFYKNFRSDWRSGLHGRVTVLYKERDWQQTRFLLEYFHSLSDGNFYNRERWIRVGLEKRFYQ